MGKFFKNLRYITFYDIFAIFMVIFAFIPALFLKFFKRKKIWIICEDKNEARDNGYWFFKYCCENKISDDIDYFYVINFKSPDFHKVKSLGKCINYSSFKHYVYYLAADRIISSQKAGNPDAAVFYFLEVYGILKNNRVFLQHGITLSDAEWLYYNNTKMRLFICGAKPEYNYVKKNFGYPSDNVVYTGFPRFDNLHDFEVKDNVILIMPSWREWLTRKTDAFYDFNYDGIFEHSDYFKCWNGLLNNSDFISFVEKNNLKVIFYPHRNMQPYINNFSSNSKNVVIAKWSDYDIQELLKEASIMITDYSSVFMDFSYMHKPVLFYQFDYDNFRKGQYKEGYFDYRNYGIGKAANSVSELLKYLVCSFENNFELDSDECKEINKFFKLNDDRNCERIYNEVLKL